jgi:NAD(P)-dependent dehydrogenase (short-subunit alcohol dehydrogenase family)
VTGPACDVIGEAAVEAFIDPVPAGHGRLDVMVTSAGIQARGTIDELDAGTLGLPGRQRRGHLAGIPGRG